MKKLLFLLPLLLTITASAQNPFLNAGPADSSFLLPTIRQTTAAWASAHASLPGTAPAVSRKIDSSNHDPNFSIQVKLHFSQIWDVVSGLTVEKEGIAAVPNKELLTAITSVLYKHPTLAAALGAILGANDTNFNSIVQHELERLASMDSSIDDNDN